jgi:hypothetical protein
VNTNFCPGFNTVGNSTLIIVLFTVYFSALPVASTILVILSPKSFGVEALITLSRFAEFALGAIVLASW